MPEQKPPAVIRIDACRVCGGGLEEILSLGDLYLSDFPAQPDSSATPKVPLELVRCTQCTLVQLRHTTPSEWMYKEYWYRSGVNEQMVAELGDVVFRACAMVGGVGANDRVLDIGANDGTLLRKYKQPQYELPERTAFEPSQMANELEDAAEIVYQECFPPPLNHPFWKDEGPAYKVISTIAMFYDLHDPNTFVKAIKKILHPQGVWIIQLQDLDQMIGKRAFDNIGHEHLEYYSLTALLKLLARHGLVCRDIEHRAINGGSLRIYVTQAKRPAVPGGTDRIRLQLERETDLELRLQVFVQQIQSARRQIRGLLFAALQDGHDVDVYGASTKGNSLLQWVGVTNQMVRYAVERSAAKVGRYTVGSHIPIISEEQWRRDPADLTLVLIWQFREAVLAREAAYLKRKGVFVFPLPYCDVVG